MGEATPARLLLLALFTLAAPAAAQERTERPAERPRVTIDTAALSRRIARLPAAAVETATVQPGVVSAPDTTPATEATPPVVAEIGTVEPAPPRLRPRDILFVPLPQADEAKTRLAIVERLQASSPSTGTGETAKTPQVEVFEGALRMLAKQPVLPEPRPGPRGEGGGDRPLPVELTLKAVALGGSPLRYVADRRRFEGTINLGVVEITGQHAELSEPIVFQVTGPLTATPDHTSVERTAPPYLTVALAGDSVEGVVEVLVTSTVLPEGVTFKVPVLPALFVDVTPRRIQGWGLETADVEVHARALPPGGNRQVQLVADAGNLEPRRLTLDADGTGEASIRSSSTGKSTVTVSGPAFAAATVPVEFVFPTWFLLAGLIGGVAGGALRIGLPRPGKLGRFLARLAAAVTCGFLVLGLYVLGVNVVGFDLPARAGEVLVFVVAALGALGGVGLLKPPTKATS